MFRPFSIIHRSKTKKSEIKFVDKIVRLNKITDIFLTQPLVALICEDNVENTDDEVLL